MNQRAARLFSVAVVHIEQSLRGTAHACLAPASQAWLVRALLTHRAVFKSCLRSCLSASRDHWPRYADCCLPAMQ